MFVIKIRDIQQKKIRVNLIRIYISQKKKIIKTEPGCFMEDS